MIKIITVGQLKEKYLRDAMEEYLKRLQKYTKIQIIELKDQGLVEEEKAIQLEGETILKHINEKDYVITLEIEGELIDSIGFSKKLEKLEMEYSDICFIIGGSYGLAEVIKERAKWHLSFSKMTFPHQLFRVILLEQIYRSYKIRNHEKYHK